MNSLENIISNIINKNQSSNELINYLTQIIAEKCGNEIDAAISRSSLQNRSISSSISTGNSNIEKRLMHRRLRSSVNYLENLTKFQKVKTQLLKQVENSIHQCSSKNRPSTGFETLFSVDEFSEDDTLFLTNFSFSQSLRVSKAENLDGIVGILIDGKVDVEQRLAELQKLSKISPLAICRSPSFKILLQNFTTIASNPLLYPEYLSLLSSISNIRDFNSFCSIFDTFQRNLNFILAHSNISDTDKLKFVDLIKQMFACIPSICRRRPEDEITKIMSIFVQFFVSPENLMENKFLIIYGCIDANASNIEAILHFHNLRKPFYNQWLQFVITVMKDLPKLKKEDFSSFSTISQNTVWSLYRAFLSTVVLISIKYLPMDECQKLEMNDFLIWIFKVAFVKKALRGNERLNFVLYLQNRLKKVAQDQSFADIVIKSLQTMDPTNIPLTLQFAKFLYICLQTSTLQPPTISITVIQTLLNSKQRSSYFTAFQIIDKLCSSNFDPTLIQNIFTSSNNPQILNNLHPMNPIHSNILFKSGLSSSKHYWRQFRPRSILNSPGINYIQHYFPLSPEDKIVGLKILTTFLLENENVQNFPKIESGLSFLETEKPIPLPAAMEVMVEFSGILNEILRNFDLGMFFEENFNKSLKNCDGEFLRRMALLMANIDFAVECRKGLNLSTKIITHLQQYFSNFDHHKCAIDDFILGCFALLKATTIGHETELLDFISIDFQKFRMTEFSKGCYNYSNKISITPLKWTSKPIDNFEMLCQILLDHRNHQLPFTEILKQKLQHSSDLEIMPKMSSPNAPTFQWFSTICNYAVFLGKTSSSQNAHRQSLLLKLPFYDFENGGKDWFMAAIFLATKCNAKKTTEILSSLCSASIDIRCFWPAAHESIKDFIDYLETDLWPILCKFYAGSGDGKERPRFGIFVDYVYRSGFGLMDFRDIEEYILMVIWGGKNVVISYFITYWNQLQNGTNERLNIDEILQCYRNLSQMSKNVDIFQYSSLGVITPPNSGMLVEKMVFMFTNKNKLQRSF